MMDLQSVKTWAKAGSLAIALFCGGVAVHEGLPTNNDGLHPVYTDSAGVATVCYGETKNIKKKLYSTEECNIMLSNSITYYATALSDLPPMALTTYVGALDFTYNAGITAFNNSSIKVCLKRQDFSCASQAVLKYKYISKKTITTKDKSYGDWEWKSNKFYFDCSQYYKGKPNKLCFGLWERRLYESQMIAGTMTAKEAETKLLKYY